MRYLSLFSGIEACTVAWAPLGWEAVAFSEWDAAPSAVLAHHYPDVPNFGDVTKITEQDIRNLGPIDLVVGGSPCQNLSLAGNGKGLDGEKSELFFEQIRIFHLCRRIHGTRFLLWENVPGARSTNKGRDFARVVAEMAGLNDVVPPKYGWGTEGTAVGDHGLLEWGTLDAQFRGLAQRRKRVFALLDTGDWASRPPILLERESVRGDTPPSRETQQETTTIAGNCPEIPSGSHWDDRRNPHPTLNQSNNTGGIASSNQELFSQRGSGLVMTEQRSYKFDSLSSNSMKSSNPISGCNEVDLAMCLDTTNPCPSKNQVGLGIVMAYGIKATAIGRKPENGGNGLGISEEVCDTLTTADRHGVGFRMEAFGQYADDQTASTMKACDYKDATDLVINPPGIVRRLTPTECCRLQGFPDDYLDIEYKGKSLGDGHKYKGKSLGDGHKYKALGNSMAVPVMRYIGEQIQSALR